MLVLITLALNFPNITKKNYELKQLGRTHTLQTELRCWIIKHQTRPEKSRRILHLCKNPVKFVQVSLKTLVICPINTEAVK